jgi:hypothetical protein
MSASGRHTWASRNAPLVGRAAALATPLLALALIVIASGWGNEAARARVREPVLPRSEFDRHPNVLRGDEAYLARAGGWLWWSDDQCQVTAMSLATLDTRTADGEYCRIWPDPRGTIALATVGSETDAVTGRRLVVLEMEDPDRVDRPRLRVIVTVPHQDGILASPVVWRGDGSAAAFCITNAQGSSVIRVRAGVWSQHVIKGACDPVWIGPHDSQLAVVRNDQLEVAGRTLPLAARLAEEGAGQDLLITALAGHGSDLAVAAAHRRQFDQPRPPAMVFVLRGREQRADLGDIGRQPVREVGISPDGSMGWMRKAGSDLSQILTGLGQHPPRPEVPRFAYGYSWSPGGTYLAVALEHNLDIVDVRDGRSVSIAGVAARSIGWTS